MAATAPVVKNTNSPQEWGVNFQYPKNQFSAKRQQQGLDLLHFYCFHGQPIDSLQSLFQSKKEWVSQRINYQDPSNRHVTPLMLAVITGNQKWFEFLLESGSKLTPQDDYGFTALHWAALRGRNEFDQWVALIQKVRKSTEGIFHQMSKRAQTCHNVLDMIHGTLPFTKEQCVTYQGNPLTRALFQQLTGVQFLQGFLATPKQILTMNHDGSTVVEQKSVERDLALDHATLQTFFNDPPKLKVGFDDIKKFSLYANSSIQSGDCIAAIAGKITGYGEPKDKTRESGIYGYKSIQGWKGSNWGSLANDGPPNAGLFECSDTIGVFLRALRPIGPKEEIVFDSGADDICKLDRYTISSQRMQYMLQKYPEYFIQKTISDTEMVQVLLAIQYVFQTPYACMQFLLRNDSFPGLVYSLLTTDSSRSIVSQFIQQVVQDEKMQQRKQFYIAFSLALRGFTDNVYKQQLQELISNNTVGAAMTVLWCFLKNPSKNSAAETNSAFQAEFLNMQSAANLLDQVNIIAKGDTGATYVGVPSNQCEGVKNCVFDHGMFGRLTPLWKQCVLENVWVHLQWFNQQEKTIHTSERTLFDERRSQLNAILDKYRQEDQKT